MKKIESVHFAGIGGIGMSGLAAFARSLNLRVTGSDRASSAPENARIFDALKARGIEIFPQDESVYESYTPDIIVHSTALEDDNKDFVMKPAGVEKLHRSAAMELFVRMSGKRRTFSVGGTCGKTTVTAMLAEALYKAGADPSYLCGGLLNAFARESAPGNFRSGRGASFVLEADESDKSLLNYRSDVAFVLNIGTDHYPKAELEDVFRRFVLGACEFAVIELEAFIELEPSRLAEQDIVLFSTATDAPCEYASRKVYKLDSYRVDSGRAYCSFDSQEEISLSCPGLHQAANALAVYASLCRAGFEPRTACSAVDGFSGVWRRFDYAGRTSSGAAVYDDYAHNAEKIASALHTAKALSGAGGGHVHVLFQPHGFRPLEFMREELYKELSSLLEAGDTFSFLPVFYAGGTASFTPTSDEVAEDYCLRSGVGNGFYRSFANRSEAEEFIENRAKGGDLVLVAGARDNSLADWSKKIAKKLDI